MKCKNVLLRNVKQPFKLSKSCDFCFRVEDDCNILFIGITGKAMCEMCLPFITEKLDYPPEPPLAS